MKHKSISKELKVPPTNKLNLFALDQFVAPGCAVKLMSDMNIHLTWLILFSVTEVGEGKMQYVEVSHGAV